MLFRSLFYFFTQKPQGCAWCDYSELDEGCAWEFTIISSSLEVPLEARQRVESFISVAVRLSESHIDESLAEMTRRRSWTPIPGEEQKLEMKWKNKEKRCNQTQKPNVKRKEREEKKKERREPKPRTSPSCSLV